MVSRKRTARMPRALGTLPANRLQAELQGRAPKLGGAQCEAAGMPGPPLRAVWAQGAPSSILSQNRSKWQSQEAQGRRAQHPCQDQGC